MEKFDISKVGLRVGLEFHQQLYSPYLPKGLNPNNEFLIRKFGSKLFCRCPAWIRNDPPNIFVSRTFIPTVGETGKIDVAAEFEYKKDTKILYEGYRDSICLVELDEEPIQPINPIALFQALVIAKKIFKMTLIDEIQVVRKIILDGSTVSGFQRTCLIAIGNNESYIKIDNRKIPIKFVCLEEDSAKALGVKNGYRVFRLDRSGIPLIEIATDSVIKSPEEAYAVAVKIGQLLRMTNFVKRGLGTIRQDINVSIKGGARTEIKGVQKLELIPKYILNEAMRQFNLLRIINILKKRGLTKNKLMNTPPTNISSHINLNKSFFEPFNKKKTVTIFALKLPCFSNLLEVELQPNYTLFNEFVSMAKSITPNPISLYSEVSLKQILTEKELSAIKTLINCNKSDSFILSIGDSKSSNLVLSFIRDQIYHWIDKGLCEEVRAPCSDGRTTYLRPLSGESRLYPETDALPLKIDRNLLKKVEETIIDIPEDRLNRLERKYGLPAVIAQQLYTHERCPLFERIVNTFGVSPTFVATTILERITNLRRDGFNTDNITDEFLLELFETISKGKLTKTSVPIILINKCKYPQLSLKEIMLKESLYPMSDKELDAIIDEIVSSYIKTFENNNVINDSKVVGKIIQEVLQVTKGRAEGNKIAYKVKKRIAQLMK